MSTYLHVITATYPSTCTWCGGPIQPGQDIASVGRRWQHEACARVQVPS